MITILKIRWICAVLLFCSAIALGETTSGKITLKETFPEDDDPKIEVATTALKVTAQPLIMRRGPSKIVSAHAIIKNTGTQPMFFAFSIAFFDKDSHLIGYTSQEDSTKGLQSGEGYQLGSCFFHVPPEQMKNVASYQVTLFESKEKF